MSLAIGITLAIIYMALLGYMFIHIFKIGEDDTNNGN